ncbi:MAG TPA: hypothetical protein VFO52_07150 [Longimicrobiales bacterium]|nr:hypothetical protein [Longimicrobiales bacterium]
MDDTAKTAVEAQTARAIAEGPYEDFREAYRERLRWLKEARPAAFTEARAAYDALVENIARGSNPVEQWLKYGKQLGELSGRGKIVGIDASGRSGQATADGTTLILHLPDDISVPALPLAVPRNVSDPQKATFDLLVRRKLALD